MSHGVERFRKDDKRCVESSVLLPAFLLELPQHKDHVSGTPGGSKATLALWKVIADNGGGQAIQQHSCKNFSCDEEESYPTVVGVVTLFSFLLVQGDDDCIPKVLR